jgi:hypothetical protein
MAVENAKRLRPQECQQLAHGGFAGTRVTDKQHRLARSNAA